MTQGFDLELTEDAGHVCTINKSVLLSAVKLQCNSQEHTSIYALAASQLHNEGIGTRLQIV